MDSHCNKKGICHDDQASYEYCQKCVYYSKVKNNPPNDNEPVFYNDDSDDEEEIDYNDPIEEDDFTGNDFPDERF